MYPSIRVLVLLLWPSPLLAQDAVDPAAGEEHFARQCVSCHVIQDAAGEVLAGRNARTGPNLWGVAGRVPGSVEDYRYSDDMLAYGATGVVWAEENFLLYVQEPTGFLREALADPSARGKMAYRVRDAQEAANLWAYLMTFGEEAALPE